MAAQRGTENSRKMSWFDTFRGDHGCHHFHEQAAGNFMKRGALQLGMALMLLTAAATRWCARGEEPAAQEKMEKVKAAFVFNFLQFTEWPAASFEHPESPIVVGFTGDSGLVEAFRTAVAGKTENGRAVLVKQVLGAG